MDTALPNDLGTKHRNGTHSSHHKISLFTKAKSCAVRSPATADIRATMTRQLDNRSDNGSIPSPCERRPSWESWPEEYDFASELDHDCSEGEAPSNESSGERRNGAKKDQECVDDFVTFLDAAIGGGSAGSQIDFVAFSMLTPVAMTPLSLPSSCSSSP